MLGISIFMVKLFKINIFIIISLLTSGILFAAPPPPPGFECCAQFEDDLAKYNECITSTDPDQYCDPLTVDIPIYNVLVFIGGVGLVSYSVYKRVRQKKSQVKN
ncbi:hypothetical protein ACYE2N_08870 [Flavobacterium sp. MAHUQ-51]|uniref:hypothetical protein n=1 Tax=Flavobacterium sp. GCM10022190 TaxID=3252639 RepID=UPI003617E054